MVRYRLLAERPGEPIIGARLKSAEVVGGESVSVRAL